MFKQQQEDQGQKRFVKRINVKQRQFNFAEPQSPVKEHLHVIEQPVIQPPVVENQVMLYEPRKKVKTEDSFIETVGQMKNEVISQFFSSLVHVDRETEKQYNVKKEPETKKKSLIRKIEEKNKMIARKLLLNHSHPISYTCSIPPSLLFQLQADELKKMDSLSDGQILGLSNNLHNYQKPNLTLDLFKKWHKDQSNLSDTAVENLSKVIHQMPNLQELELGLQGWGYWNNNITNSALNHITTALSALRQLNALKLDLNMWAYENDQITDKGTEALLDGISQLKDLGKLEINMKGWGDSNTNITDESVNHLSKCLRKLGNLSEVKLVLWDKISKQAMRKLNKSLSELDNLTQVDLQFESSSNQPSTPILEEDKQNSYNLDHIRSKALKKRRLLFQTEAFNNIFSGIFRKEKCWDIAQKLI